jgi:DNA mismatch endonuclease (patch repair protein)
MPAPVDFSDASDLTRKVMRANGNRDTRPELTVRRALHAMGFRFRLNRNDLPGRPDIVLPRHRKIVLVNGCFWHHHRAAGCQASRLPKTRTAYWRAKLEWNRDRDERNVRALNQLGWEVLTIWECELRDRAHLKYVLGKFLRRDGD